MSAYLEMITAPLTTTVSTNKTAIVAVMTLHKNVLAGSALFVVEPGRLIVFESSVKLAST